jgi:ATP-dependent helicase/nuclease subunit A
MTSNEQILAEDAASRRRALDLESFIVEAPAGAGKTELLTQRYLRLLALVAEPEEIVAITFTLKAAAEMRNRILANLELAAAGVEPEAPHQRTTFGLARAALRASAERGWALLQHPGRLRITTIDSLCASLARQMPFLSRFGAQPNICDNPQRHYEEAARRTLALIEEEGAEAEVVSAALRHVDNDVARLMRLLAKMLAKRDQWLRHALNHSLREEAERGLQGLVRRDLAAAANCVDVRLQGLLRPAARFAAAHVAADSGIAALSQWNAPLSADAADLPLWRALCNLLLTKDGKLRSRVDKTIGLATDKEAEPFKKTVQDCLQALGAIDGAAEAIARIRRLPDPCYTEEEWRSVEALAGLLKLAAAQLWGVFFAAGEADFVEVAQRALLALGDEEAPSDLALRLDYRIQHLLVDEFQDTSPTQVQLLRRLTAEWQPGDGRTLFAVGDPMQSIYRFRKADVGLFLRAVETGIGGIALTRLQLTRNNRSCAAVVDWINAAFVRVFPRQDSVAEGAIRYRRFAPTRAPLPGAGVQVHPLLVAKEMPDELANLIEARCILEILDSEWHEDRTRRIAVLVRARNHLEALVAEIRRHWPGLRFQAVEIEGLAARQCVQDLLSLTRALHHRADRVHWLAILRAPWCGLTLHDLHALAGDDHATTIWRLMNDEERCRRLSDDGQMRLGHVREVLAAALAHQGRQSPRRWVEGVWLQLGGAQCLAGAGDATDAKAFLDLIDRLDAGARFTLEQLEAETDRLYAAPDARADGRLQFMTVHKAKGLEFDTVILPGLHRKARSDEAPLLQWEEVVLEGLEEHLIAAPLRKRGSKGEVATPYDFLRALEKERSDNETARILYVAATRAIRSLHLVAVASPNSKGEPGASANTALGLLWDTVAADFARVTELSEDEDSGDRVAAADFVPGLVRLAAPAVPGILRGEGMAAASLVGAAEASDGEEVANALDAGVGTLVHNYLEMIAHTGAEAWPAERLQRLRPAMLLWLRQHGIAGAEAEQGAERVGTMLLNTVTSRDGRWVLTPRPGGGAELALANGDGGRVATHIVDRSFVDDGVRWIIDYKTAVVEASEAAMRAHAEQYRPQLQRYAALFAHEALPPRTAIFYTAVGRLIEIAG